MASSLASELIRQAKAAGYDPLDLATAISFETGGTFNPRIAGPVTKWGRHVGLIQMGGPQRKQFGYDPNGSEADQVAAVIRYLQATGVKPGMGILDLYSAINAGAPGRYTAKDGATNVAQKVASFGPHRKKAEDFLAGLYTPVAGGKADATHFPDPTETGSPEDASQALAALDKLREEAPLDNFRSPSGYIPVPELNKIGGQDSFVDRMLKQFAAGVTDIPLVAGEMATGGLSLLEQAAGADDQTSVAVNSWQPALDKLSEAIDAPAPSGFFERAARTAPWGVPAGPIGMGIAGLIGGVGAGFEASDPAAANADADQAAFDADHMFDTSSFGKKAPEGYRFNRIHPELNEIPNGSKIEFESNPGSWFDAVVGPANAAEAADRSAGSVPLVTEGGSTRVSQEKLNILGDVFAANAGMMLGPYLLGAAMRGLGPKGVKWREVDPTGEFAPAGLRTIETMRDIMSSQVFDANNGLKMVAKRAGVDPAKLALLDNVLDVTTYSAGDAMIRQAMNTGSLDAVAGIYQSRVAPYKLHEAVASMPPQMQAHFDQYMRALDTLNNKNAVGRRQLLRDVATLDRAYPHFANLLTDVNDAIRAAHQFASQGTFASMTTKQATKPANWIPNGKSPMAGTIQHIYDVLQNRLHNENRGLYIDMLKNSPDGKLTWAKITKRQFDNNQGKWATVKIKRNGKDEYYATTRLQRDLLEFDPHFYTGLSAGIWRGWNNFLRFNTTGYGNPFFSITHAWREVKIGKVTAPSDLYKPTVRHALLSIPKQLGPRIAKTWADSIEASLNNGTNGWFAKTLGPQRSQSLAKWLADVHHKSLVATVERIHPYNVALTQRQLYSTRSLMKDSITQEFVQSLSQKFPNTIAPTLRFADQLRHGFMNLVDSTQNSGNFAFIMRNWKDGDMAHNRRVLQEARRLTGDYTKGGLSYIGKDGRPIAYDPVRNNIATRWAPRLVGAGAETYRLIVPWAEPTLQGMRRIGQAYLDNPIQFTARVWRHVVAPAVAAYFWNRAHGNDPTGKSYVEYWHDDQSDHKKTMNTYIADPRKRAEEGWFFPQVQEFSPFARVAVEALDHMLRTGQVNAFSEDFMQAARSFLNVTVAPAVPVPFALGMSLAGMSPPTNMFTGEGGYIPKRAPFDQEHLPLTLELIARNVGGPLIAHIAQSYLAMNAEPGGLVSKAIAGINEMAHQVGGDIPIVAQNLRLKPSSGETAIQRELFDREATINDLSKFFMSYNPEGMYKSKLRSKEGAKAVGLGDVPDMRPLPGVIPGEIKNPLFKLYAMEIHKKLDTDTSDPTMKGVMSLWSEYGNITKELNSLRGVDAGHMAGWRERVLANPDLVRVAKALKITLTKRTDPVAWINSLERYHNSLAKRILVAMKSVEADISRRIGRKITVNDLDPYKEPK